MARREGDGRREGVMRGARVAAAAAMASFSKVNRVLATVSFSGPNLEANFEALAPLALMLARQEKRA